MHTIRKLPLPVLHQSTKLLKQELEGRIASEGYIPLFLRLAAHRLGHAPVGLRKQLPKRTTKISWTDDTFNAWVGCTKISPECGNCYACDIDKRMFGGKAWGPDGERHRTAPSTWSKALKLELDAINSGQSRRVFCMSMGDVFEDLYYLKRWRQELFFLIEACRHLTWQVLTKRPNNIAEFVPLRWLYRWPKHIAIGVSAGHEVSLGKIDALLQIPAPTKFISVEPLLSRVDLRSRLAMKAEDGSPEIKLVMCGGESGSRARPTHIDWIREVRDSCGEHAVRFHFKQHGCYLPESQLEAAAIDRIPNGKKSIHFWPDGTKSYRVGVANAGRLLDGVEHLDVLPSRTWQPGVGLQRMGGVA